MRNAQNDLVSLIGYVQERAVVGSCEYRLYIDTDEGTYWVERMAGYEDGEKLFEPADAKIGAEQQFPEYLEIQRFKGREDRTRGAQYIACYPNGACDRIEFTVQDARNRRREFTIRTLGAMGKVELERKS